MSVNNDFSNSLVKSSAFPKNRYFQYRFYCFDRFYICVVFFENVVLINYTLLCNPRWDPVEFRFGGFVEDIVILPTHRIVIFVNNQIVNLVLSRLGCFPSSSDGKRSPFSSDGDVSWIIDSTSCLHRHISERIDSICTITECTGNPGVNRISGLINGKIFIWS